MTEPEGIPAFLDRRPIVYSYTFLDTYDNKCPFLAAQRYVYRTTKYVETPEMKWGNDVHSAFEHRIGAQKPLPLEMQKWEGFASPFDGLGAKTEQKLAIDKEGRSCGYWSDEPQVWLRGKVDTTLMQGTTAYFCDWKTGNSKYESSFELEVGALLLHASNPHLTKIAGQYAWLKEDRLGQMYDLSDTTATWHKVNSIVKRIEADITSGNFAKNKTPLCRFCELFTCENNTNPKRPT